MHVKLPLLTSTYLVSDFITVCRVFDHERYHTSRLQLTSSRSTRYETLSSEPPPGNVHYIPRQTLAVSELSSLSASQVPYKEFDTVGLVAHFSSTSCFPRHTEVSDSALDLICVVDLSGILLVKVWGGVKVR